MTGLLVLFRESMKRGTIRNESDNTFYAFISLLSQPQEIGYKNIPMKFPISTCEFYPKANNTKSPQGLPNNLLSCSHDTCSIPHVHKAL